jgi:hypothetical protein
MRHCREIDASTVIAVQESYASRSSFNGRCLRRLRDTIEALGPNYPERLDFDHLVAGQPE